MKSGIFIATALAVASMTIVSQAKDASDKPDGAVAANAEISNIANGNEAPKAGLMQQLLRAGNAAAKFTPGAKTDAREPRGVKVASTDPTVTGSIRATGRAGKASEGGAGALPYHSIVSRYAGEYGVPVSLAHAVIRLESNYRVSARGRAGEIGLMQIKPSTARMMGYGGSAKQLYEPETNIKYGMKYLGEAFKLGGGNTCTAILKYNAGHAAKRMNPVSSAYCEKVKRILGAG